MIDPITALAGLQSAISVVKKASKVANDLAGLAPSIAKMFDAKSVATKAMVEAKRSGNKSNLGTALQIEMALDEAKRFEEKNGTDKSILFNGNWRTFQCAGLWSNW